MSTYTLAFSTNHIQVIMTALETEKEHLQRLILRNQAVPDMQGDVEAWQQRLEDVQEVEAMINDVVFEGE